MHKLVIKKIRMVFRAAVARVRASLNGSRISLSAKLYLYPGATLRVGRGVKVMYGCVLSVLPDATLELGDHSALNPGTFVYCADSIKIGTGARVAHYCSILDHDYAISSSGASFEEGKISSPVVIGKNVWLGAHVMVMKGVSIGDGAVIGAQSMVRRSVPDNTLAYCASNSQLTLKEL